MIYKKYVLSKWFIIELLLLKSYCVSWKKFKINIDIEDEFEVIWKVKVKIINGFNCFYNLWI